MLAAPLETEPNRRGFDIWFYPIATGKCRSQVRIFVMYGPNPTLSLRYINNSEDNGDVPSH